MLDTFRKTFYLVGRERPGRWLLVVVGAIAASGFEMAGALLIVVLLGLVADPGSGIELPLLGDVREWFAGTSDEAFLLGTVAALGIFFAARIVIQIGFTYVTHRLAQNAGARISSKLALGYLRLPYSFHLRRTSAELVRNTQQSVEELARQCFIPVIQVIAESVIVIGLIAVMLVIAPAATGLAVLVVGSAAVFLLRIVQPKLKRLGRRSQAMRRSTLSSLQQSLHGVRDIKILGAEEYFGKEYARDRRALARTLYLRGAISETPRHVIETALFGFILVLLALNVTTGMGDDNLISTLGLFAYAGLRIMPSLQKVLGGLNNIRFAGAAIDQVYDDVRIVEKAGVSTTEENRTRQLQFTNELRLNRIGFTYDLADRPALRDVELTIRPGEFVGICGPTGGGKTTLTDIISGVLSPSVGIVTVDGQDIHDNPAAWMKKLGVVPQMVFLTDNTLRDNIALGVAAGEVVDDRVREAVRLAQLDDFVASLPGGLDTEIGERGVRVSGGQRQRIAIARALYRRPEVLIFDEGTSALDNATEAALMSSLEKLRGGRTIFVVAHRLTTVKSCDKIVFLENGLISGIGTFDELRSSNDGFRRLAHNA